jgi:hypothetical protein
MVSAHPTPGSPTLQVERQKGQEGQQASQESKYTGTSRVEVVGSSGVSAGSKTNAVTTQFP